MNKKQLISMFSEACAINSPSGKEGKMAMWIKKELEFAGWEVWTDNAGKKNGSDTGNVYSYMEVNPDFETVAFVAHMDSF